MPNSEVAILPPSSPVKSPAKETLLSVLVTPTITRANGRKRRIPKSVVGPARSQAQKCRLSLADIRPLADGVKEKPISSRYLYCLLIGWYEREFISLRVKCLRPFAGHDVSRHNTINATKHPRFRRGKHLPKQPNKLSDVHYEKRRRGIPRLARPSVTSNHIHLNKIRQHQPTNVEA